MAKKKAGSVNKSQAIRDYYAENPKAKPAEVAEAMQALGLDVNAQYVSTVRTNSKKKKTGKRGRPPGSKSTKTSAPKKTAKRRGRPPARPTHEVSLDSLIAVKGIVDEMGGVDEARNALSALEQLID